MDQNKYRYYIEFKEDNWQKSSQVFSKLDIAMAIVKDMNDNPENKGLSYRVVDTDGTVYV